MFGLIQEVHHTGAMMDRGLGYPADLYFEGSDQYRGWFNSCLIIGTAVHGQSPYKQVIKPWISLWIAKGLKCRNLSGMP